MSIETAVPMIPTSPVGAARVGLGSTMPPLRGLSRLWSDALSINRPLRWSYREDADADGEKMAAIAGAPRQSPPR